MCDFSDEAQAVWTLTSLETSLVSILIAVVVEDNAFKSDLNA